MIRHDAEELGITAPGIGAQFIRGPVRYPGRNGGVEVGGVAIERTLRELRDQEVLLIVAPLDSAQKPSAICELCGNPHEEAECLARKAKREEAERAAEERLLFDDEFSALLSEG
ncbi:MAG: hypothetical protein GTO63_31305 [Anaerolineae bacterium]|nr:hypothetical protein [Anaerolineae bacterium]NIN99179.1 hypothetical protein [Anaerolineae bacterium]NIQ82020.1 hypothetical protein [Anaerolineae bacterium]